MISEKRIEQLQCPTCGCKLPASPEAHELQCAACDTRYPARDGVIDLIPYAALTGPVWERWKRHLDGFASRRRQRVGRQRAGRDGISGQAGGQQLRWSKTHAAFYEFAELPPGNVLDIGCGPGGFCQRLDPQRNVYFGLDPLADDGNVDFPLVRGIAERIPFEDGAFAALVVSSALDHFCDAAAFFHEAVRVLAPDGKLLIQQSIHESRGVVGAIRMLIHKGKDVLDNLRTAQDRNGAPKHITEYTRDALVNATRTLFSVEAVKEFHPTWYSPSKLFVSLRPLAA